MVQPTAFTLSAFNSFRTNYPLDAAIHKGIAWLLPKQNADGGFGNSPSTIHDTAVALSALRDTGVSTLATEKAINYLFANQGENGSWQGSSFLTALATEALWKGQVASDFEVLTTDISFSPSEVTATPADITVVAQVRNLGRTAVSRVKVSLYAGDPALGILLGDQLVDVAGNGASQVQFVTNVAEDGIAVFTIVVDEDDLFVEGNEWNNSATAVMVVNWEPPVVSFEGIDSAGSETVGNVLLTVNLDHAWNVEVSVPYTVNAASTASAFTDFSMAAGPLLFVPGEVSKTISITITDDLQAEMDEEIVVDLGTPSLGSLGGAQYHYTIFDNEPPAVTIVSPEVGLGSNNNPLLQFNTTAGSVVVSLDGMVVAKQSGDTLGPLSDGDHWVDLLATNTLGVSSSDRVDFSIDSRFPVVFTINSPVGLISEAAPVLDFTVEGAISVLVKIDGVVVAKQSGESLDPLAEGPHLFTIEATNVLGLKSSKSSNFVVDLVLPEIKIESPQMDGILGEDTPALFFAQSEPGLVSVSIDGSLGFPISSGDLLPVLVDGEHTLRVELTNDWGTTVSDQVTFVVALGPDDPWVLGHSFPLNLSGDLAVDKMGNVHVGKNGRVEKYSSAGVLIWSVDPWSNLWFQPGFSDIGVDSKGNVFVAFTYNNDGTTPPGIVQLGYQDILLAKISPDGVPGRPKRIATASSDLICEMVIDAEDNVYLAGLTGSSLFPSVGVNSGFKTWVAKYAGDFNDEVPGYDDNTHLTPIWGFQISQNSGTFPAGVYLSVSPSGDVFVAGDTYGALNLQGPYLGGSDFYIAHWDSSGQFEGFVQGGTAGDETVAGLGTDALGHVYLTGSTTGVFDGTSATGPFVVRYDTVFLNPQLGTLSEAPVDMQVEWDGDLYFTNNQTLSKLNRDFGFVWSEQAISSGAFKPGGFSLDDRGYLYAMTPVGAGAELRVYQDPRLPEVSLDVMGDTSVLPAAAGGTLSAGASIGIFGGTDLTLSNVQYPTTTTWRGDFSPLVLGPNAIEVYAKNSAGFKGYAQGIINLLSE
jgi:hypothetical protein